MGKVIFSGTCLDDEPIEFWVEYVLGGGGGAEYFVTPNVDHFYRLDFDDAFRRAYAAADYRICDSRIVQKLSMVSGVEVIKNVVPGSDLTRELLVRLGGLDKKIAIVGPPQKDIDVLIDVYQLKAAVSFSPSMGFIKRDEEVASLVDEIFGGDFSIVFLAVGSPQQEILAQRLKARFFGAGGPKILCIGASIDFLSGKINRAPKIMQQLHLEWLHRLVSDPKRLLPRYYKNLVWIVRFLVVNKRGR